MFNPPLAVKLAEHGLHDNCYMPAHIESPLCGQITRKFLEQAEQKRHEALEALRR